MEFYRYYTIMRPPMPGAIPKEGLVGVKGFSERTFISSIGRQAWGFADYNRILTEAEISQYDLATASDYGGLLRRLFE